MGVKPPRLNEVADRTLGRQIFVEEKNADERVRQVAIHELTHAFCEHLRLPHWLKEGVAMVAVDRVVGEETVLRESLDRLARGGDRARPERRMSVRLDPEALLDLYVRGYWTTRFLDEEQPGLLRELLSRRRPAREIDAMFGAVLGADPQAPWSRIDEVVRSHFAAPEKP